jgi:hypothetical protein
MEKPRILIPAQELFRFPRDMGNAGIPTHSKTRASGDRQR